MDRKLALLNGIARVFTSYHNILCCWHINKNILLIARHTSPMSNGNSLWGDGICLSPARRLNYSMQLLVYSKRPIREPIQLPSSMLTRHGCLTRRSLLPVTLTSFPTLAALVSRGWKETTTLSSRISVSALFTS